MWTVESQNSKGNKMDNEKEPGIIARTRKAWLAGLAALASSAGPLIIATTEDGTVSGGDLLAILVTSVGLGVGTFLLTWAVPNAKA